MPYPGPQPRPAIPPPPTQGNGFGAGLAQFIDAYRNERRSKKQEAAANFDRHMALLQQGLPGVDLKKMAKWAREAGLELDFDANYAQQQQPQQQAPPPPPSRPAMPQAAPQMGGPGGPMPQQAAPQMGGSGGPPPGVRNIGPGAGAVPPPPSGPQAQPMPPAQERQGFFKRLGAAMGVPQPPSASQQRGALQMLSEMQKRGVMSREMQEMAQGMQRKVMQLTGEVEELIAGGATMEDDRVMTRLMQLMALSGNIPQGGAMGMAMAQKMAPNTIAKAQQAEQQAAMEKEKISFRKSITDRLSPEQAAKAEGWVFNQPGAETPDYTTIDPQALNEATVKLTSEHPGADQFKIKKAALLMFDPNADPAELSASIKALGDSITQTRLKLSLEQAEREEASAGRAAEAHSMSMQEKREDRELQSVAGRVLSLANGDPDRAYDNVKSLTLWAVGGDRNKLKKYLPEVQRMLKQNSKNPDWLQELLKEK